MSEADLEWSRTVHLAKTMKLIKDTEQLLATQKGKQDDLLRFKVTLSSKLEKVVKLDGDILMLLCQNTKVGEGETAAETESTQFLLTEIKVLIVTLNEMLATAANWLKSPRTTLPVVPSSPHFPAMSLPVLQETPTQVSLVLTDVQRPTQMKTGDDKVW